MFPSRNRVNPNHHKELYAGVVAELNDELHRLQSVVGDARHHTDMD